jgi:hypothetical protein
MLAGAFLDTIWQNIHGVSLDKFHHCQNEGALFYKRLKSEWKANLFPLRFMAVSFNKKTKHYNRFSKRRLRAVYIDALRSSFT